jgi:hypothetical protein
LIEFDCGLSNGDINVVRRENQELFKQLEEVGEQAAKTQKAIEQERLTKELEDTKQALAAAESKGAENAKIMAELEGQLSRRLEEVAAVDSQVLGIPKSTKSFCSLSSCIELIKRLLACSALRLW